jgi:tetratricopeptide (TPR) repeat protein
MEGLAAGLAKQKFSEAIESLRKRDGQAAWDAMDYALSGGLADAACGLMLLKIFAARKDQYSGITREMEATLKRLAEQPTTLEISGYGYYLLGRCYAVLGIKREKFQSNSLRTVFKRMFRNKLMEKASSFYLQSIARDTSFVEAIFELGLVYEIGLNSRSKAIEAYKMVTELNPNHLAALENLANLYNETKRPAEAQEETEHLVRLNLEVISYSASTSINSHQGDTEEASLASRNAMELPPQPGITGEFSSRAHLLSPETVAPIPEPKRDSVLEFRHPDSQARSRSSWDWEAHRMH